MFGANSEGQLGLGYTSAKVSPQLLPSPNNQRITTAVLGAHHSAFQAGVHERRVPQLPTVFYYGMGLLLLYVACSGGGGGRAWTRWRVRMASETPSLGFVHAA